MPKLSSFRRILFLSLGLFPACVAASQAAPGSAPADSTPGTYTGAVGAYLDARFAAAQAESDQAAGAYLRALVQDALGQVAQRNADAASHGALLQPALD